MAKNKKKKKSQKAATPAPKNKGRWLILAGMIVIMFGVYISNSTPAKDAKAPLYTYEVVSKIEHDPSAFTQGFLFFNGYLYESTGQRGHSSIRKIDPATGTTLLRKDLEDRYFAEGLAYSKGVLIQLTWQAGIAFVYNSDTFEVLRDYRYDTEGWGLTHDGENYIMSDGSDQLTFRDAFFKIHKTLKVTDGGKMVTRLNELEFINGEIWANVWQTDDIVRIDPATGQVTGRIKLRGILKREDRNGDEDYLNGIAYDPKTERLWVTGKNYSYIYEIRISPKSA